MRYFERSSILIYCINLCKVLLIGFGNLLDTNIHVTCKHNQFYRFTSVCACVRYKFVSYYYIYISNFCLNQARFTVTCTKQIMHLLVVPNVHIIKFLRRFANVWFPKESQISKYFEIRLLELSLKRYKIHLITDLLEWKFVNRYEISLSLRWYFTWAMAHFSSLCIFFFICFEKFQSVNQLTQPIVRCQRMRHTNKIQKLLRQLCRCVLHSKWCLLIKFNS